MTDTPATSS